MPSLSDIGTIALALSCPLLLATCGDSSPATVEAPKRIRFCGELDDVAPVEPNVLGEDEYGCPMIEPVPCTRPPQEQEWACGTDCETVTAFRSDGDEWVMGCLGGTLQQPDGCAPVEPDPPPYCLLDPSNGEEWIFPFDCGGSAAFFVSRLCWTPCDARTADFLGRVCP